MSDIYIWRVFSAAVYQPDAVYMTEKVPYEKLFKEADSVLYEVKTRGKNSFEIRKI